MSAANVRLPRPKTDLIFKSLADGGLLYSPSMEVYFSLNGVGARILSLLPPETQSFDELVARLAAEYPDVGADVIAADVKELLEEFLRQGLVEPAA